MRSSFFLSQKADFHKNSTFFGPKSRSDLKGFPYNCREFITEIIYKIWGFEWKTWNRKDFIILSLKPMHLLHDRFSICFASPPAKSPTYWKKARACPPFNTKNSTKTRGLSEISQSFHVRTRKFMYNEQKFIKIAIERGKNGVTSCPYSRELFRVCFNTTLQKTCFVCVYWICGSFSFLIV